MQTKKIFTTVAATAAIALAVSACGGGSGDRSGSETLTLGAVFPPSTFAANNSAWGNEAPYLQAVYDTLVRVSPDGEIEPWLATGWEYDDTRTVLTMTLRDDVMFTDGTKFDAAAAAQNLLRFRDGAAPNKSALTSVSDATAVDPTTLKITLSQPDPTLLYVLSRNSGLMASPKHFGASDEKTNPVGSGPYILDTGATVAGSKYVFTQNPDYWAKDDQHYEAVNINVYTVQAAVNAMQGKQIDGALVDADQVKQVEAAGYEVKTEQQNWAGLNLFDRNGTMNPALGDVRVRRAINHAIDRDALLKAAQGYGAVTDQIFAETNPGYVPALDGAYTYDPTKAKQLLAEAGYGNGFTLSMPLVPEFGIDSMYDLVKQYLTDVGITVDYVTVSVNNLVSDLLSPKFAAAPTITALNPLAWHTARLQIAPNATFNPFRVEDPAVDELLKTIQTGADADADAAAKQLNELVTEQAWFAPFYRADSLYGVSEDTDVTLQSDNDVPYLYNYTPKE
ncbi:ABC transporter substrate-binding protein [Rhodococcus sp. C26F]